MSDTAVSLPPAPRRRFRALLRPLRYLRFAIILFVVIVIALMIYNAWLMHRVAQVRAEVHAQGGMVSIEALNVAGLSDATNAAIPYRHANGFILRLEQKEEYETALLKLQRTGRPACLPQEEPTRRDRELGTDQPLTADEHAMLEEYIRETAVAMTYVEEANALPHFRLGPEEYAPGQVPVVAHGNGLRKLGRHLSHRAQYFALQGNPDEAFKSVVALMRLARHMQQEPFLINGLIQAALTWISLESLQIVLATVPPETSVPPAIAEALQPLRRLDAFVFTIESERLFPVLVMHQMNAGLFKFFWLRSEISMHQQVRTLSVAMRTPHYATREALLAPLRVFAQEPLGFPVWDVSRIALPAYLSSVDGHLRTVAHADMAWAALLLRAHKQQTGAYPEPIEGGLDMDQLQPSPGDAPGSDYFSEGDPFSGKPYRYERVGEGYKLWSLGADRDDDGGTPDRRNDGDEVWCMDQ